MKLEGSEMIRRIIALAICFTAITVESVAQELGIDLSGGLQGTQYSLQNGKATLLPGGSLGLSYAFRLGRNWNLLTGVAGGIYRTQATLQDGTAFTSYQVDDAGSAFQYTVKTTGYKETQQFIAASIPVLFQYHTAGPHTQWYLSAGGRALLPLTANVQLSAKQVSLTGYYPDYNIQVSNVPQHGFGTINNWKASQTVQLKPSAVLSAATGFGFRLSPGTGLYIGIYVDYGLTELKSRNDSMPFTTYSPTGISQLQANSVLKMPIAGQMTLLSFGLQVRFGFGSAKVKPAARAPKKQEPQPKPEPQQQPQQPTALHLNSRDTAFIQKPIVFGAFNETDIPDIEKDHLDELVNVLKQIPTIRISIVGHVCSNLTDSENIKIGEIRAETVAKYLRDKGIDRDRIEVGYQHESDPMLPNNPSANYQRRRATITMK